LNQLVLMVEFEQRGGEVEVVIYQMSALFSKEDGFKRIEGMLESCVAR